MYNGLLLIIGALISVLEACVEGMPFSQPSMVIEGWNPDSSSLEKNLTRLPSLASSMEKSRVAGFSILSFFDFNPKAVTECVLSNKLFNLGD